MSDNFDNSTLETLDWSLDIFSPLGAFIKTITQATSPNPIMGSPTAIVDDCGHTVEIRFEAKQSILEITPRQIIRFCAAPGTVPVASGVVVTCPPVESEGAGPDDQDADALQRITCVGLEQLMMDSVVGTIVFDEDTDISTIAYQACLQYAHPGLTVTESNFPASGFEVGAWYAPYRPLKEFLENLLKQYPPGGCIYVNPNLEIIWELNPMSIPM